MNDPEGRFGSLSPARVRRIAWLTALAYDGDLVRLPVVGPIWVWLVLREVPQATTLFAGSLIIITLAIHTLSSLWAPRQHAAMTGPTT